MVCGLHVPYKQEYYSDVIMSVIVSQITGVSMSCLPLFYTWGPVNWPNMKNCTDKHFPPRTILMNLGSRLNIHDPSGVYINATSNALQCSVLVLSCLLTSCRDVLDLFSWLLLFVTFWTSCGNFFGPPSVTLLVLRSFAASDSPPPPPPPL